MKFTPSIAFVPSLVLLVLAACGGGGGGGVPKNLAAANRTALFNIDPATGTTLGSLSRFGIEGFSYEADNHRLLGVSLSNDQWLEIDRSNGSITVIGRVGSGLHALAGPF